MEGWNVGGNQELNRKGKFATKFTKNTKRRGITWMMDDGMLE